MVCLIILTFKHEKSFWLVLKCIRFTGKQTYKTKKQQKTSFQMNNIFNYLKKELIIQHVKYNYDR